MTQQHDTTTRKEHEPLNEDGGWTNEDEAHNNHLINLILIEQYPWNF